VQTFLQRARFLPLLAVLTTQPNALHAQSTAAKTAHQPALESASGPAPKPALIGYFPQWGIYNQPQYLVKNLATGTTPLVDQINYAQGFVTNGHCSIADPNADLNYTFTADQSVDGKPDTPSQVFRGNLHQLQKLKLKFPNLRIVISLEGHSPDFADDAQPANRAAFVTSCIDTFLKGQFAPGITIPNLFDGIDIDWSTPISPTPPTTSPSSRNSGGKWTPSAPVSSSMSPSDQVRTYTKALTWPKSVASSTASAL